eukprot:4072102-Prorocentrum_lima.AAC.1
MQGLIHMMKQQLKEIKETPSSTEEVRGQQADSQVRREELYLPQAIQDEVKKTFEHGSPIQQQDCKVAQ